MSLGSKYHWGASVAGASIIGEQVSREQISGEQMSWEQLTGEHPACYHVKSLKISLILFSAL